MLEWESETAQPFCFFMGPPGLWKEQRQLTHQWVVVKRKTGFVEAGKPGFSSRFGLLYSWVGQLRVLRSRQTDNIALECSGRCERCCDRPGFLLVVLTLYPSPVPFSSLEEAPRGLHQQALFPLALVCVAKERRHSEGKGTRIEVFMQAPLPSVKVCRGRAVFWNGVSAPIKGPCWLW